MNVLYEWLTECLSVYHPSQILNQLTDFRETPPESGSLETTFK